jgi:hypothetical protein
MGWKSRTTAPLLVGLLLAWPATIAGPGIAQESLANDRPAGAPARDPAQIVWRSQRACGVNSLYVLLKVHGHSPNYIELNEQLLSSGREPSLADLQRSASAHQLPCEVGKATPAVLDRLAKPVLAHLDISEDTQTAELGHFVLVLATAPESITAMDGTTGMIRAMPRPEFERRWTGYILYTPAAEGVPWGSVLACGLLGLVLAWGVQKLVRRRQTLRCEGPVAPTT